MHSVQPRATTQLDIAAFDDAPFRPAFEAAFKKDMAAGYTLLSPANVFVRGVAAGSVVVKSSRCRLHTRLSHSSH